MRVLWIVLGDRNIASSRVRAYWLEEHLQRLGVKPVFHAGGTKTDLIRMAFRICGVESVIFQKQYSRWDVWLARWARLLGKFVILDLDDAPSRTRNERTMRNAARMMRASSAVTVGCANLHQYARKYNPNCHIIPSCIRLEDYAPRADAGGNGVVTLGWIGNGAHYCRDLVDILAAPLRDAAARQPMRFRIVGACGQKELQEVFGAIPNLEFEMIDQIDWAAPGATATAMEGVDIGLYPLLDNDFNRHKCGFKALEYMALGLPVIASPISANTNLVRDRIDGFLCRTSGEWVEAIAQLASSPASRREMGRAARARVEERFTTGTAAELLMQAHKRLPGEESRGTSGKTRHML